MHSSRRSAGTGELLRTLVPVSVSSPRSFKAPVLETSPTAWVCPTMPVCIRIRDCGHSFLCSEMPVPKVGLSGSCSFAWRAMAISSQQCSLLDMGALCTYMGFVQGGPRVTGAKCASATQDMIHALGVMHRAGSTCHCSPHRGTPGGGNMAVTQGWGAYLVYTL